MCLSNSEYSPEESRNPDELKQVNRAVRLKCWRYGYSQLRLRSLVDIEKVFVLHVALAESMDACGRCRLREDVGVLASAVAAIFRGEDHLRRTRLRLRSSRHSFSALLHVPPRQ